MVGWKVALPVAIAGSGIAAAAVATFTGDDTAEATTTVWIDAPADLAALHPGTVVVQAHVDVGNGIDSLTLTVDGSEVATDEQLDVVADLARAEFQWQAAPGVHELRVLASDGSASGARTAFVTEPGDEATTTSTTTTVAATTTTVAETTTTSTTTTLPPTTAPPLTTAPPTTIPKPVIGTIGVAPGDCSITVNVSSIRNATSATARLTGAGNDTATALAPVPGAASGTLLITVVTDLSTPLTVTVTATGPGGTSTAAASVTAVCGKP